MMVDKDRDELRDSTGSTKSTKGRQELSWVPDHCRRRPVQQDEVGARRIKLIATQIDDIFGPKDVQQSSNWLLFIVGGDVRHERQVFDQATRFSLRSIGRTQHAEG